MPFRLDRGLKVALTVVSVLLLLDLAVMGLVGAGALDPNRFGIGNDDKPVVVVSTTILDDFVFRVAGDRVHRELLVGPGGDPHLYVPTPRDQVAVEGAKLIVLNGHGLEPEIEKMVGSVLRNDQVLVEGAAGLTPRQDPADPTEPDPHLWLSIPLAKTYVDNVRDGLIRIDPGNARLYRANADAYKAELDLVDAYVHATLATIPEENRLLVTTHDAFRYFGEAYGIRVVDTVWGVTTDADPTAEDLRRIVEAIRALGVPAVFIEDSVNPKLLQTIAEEAGVGIGGTLYSDSLGFPGSGAHTYTSMMMRNAESLARGLGGDATGART